VSDIELIKKYARNGVQWCHIMREVPLNLHSGWNGQLQAPTALPTGQKTEWVAAVTEKSLL
jgi:hypothetical protein